MNNQELYEYLISYERPRGVNVKSVLCTTQPEIYKNIQRVLGKKVTMKQLFDYLQPEANKNCLTCGLDTPFFLFNTGYNSFCGPACSHGHERTKARRVSCVQKKYGVDNVSQAKEVAKKKIETCRENFGVDFPTQSAEVLATRKDNELDISGGTRTSAAQRPEERDRRSILGNHGIAGFGSEGFKNWTRLQGVSNPSQLSYVKARKMATSKEKYGVDHPMKDPKVFADRMNRLHRTTEYVLNGVRYFLQGYEPKALSYLVEVVGLPQKSITVPDFNVPYRLNGKSRRYYPDLIVGNVCVEVKSEYTAGLNANGRTSNELRAKAYGVLSSGREYLLMIMDKTGSLVSWSYDGVVLNKSPLVGNNFEGRP
jgi:hypothetical protein